MCKINNCIKKVLAKGMCSTHYMRWRKYGDPLFIKRRENGSGSLSSNKTIYIYKPKHPNSTKNGKIAEHIFVMSESIGRKIKENEIVIHIDGNKSNNKIENLKLENKNTICSVKDCNKKIRCSSLCEKHYTAYLKHNDPEVVKRAANGDGSITHYGYKKIYKPNHPNSIGNGVIFEHRYVMSEYLGRPLNKNENVHHKNGNRLDNRIENLELWSKSQPCGQRVVDLVDWAKSIVKKYGNEYEKLKSNKHKDNKGKM